MDHELDPNRLARFLPELLQHYVPDPAATAASASQAASQADGQGRAAGERKAA